MRALALLTAFTIMHTTHAVPRPDLAAREAVNDLSNDRHVFHHLDRNQRTASRDRERLQAEGVEGSGLYVVRRLAEKPQRAGWQTIAKEGVLDRRFMQDPDYSEGDESSASRGSDTTRKAKGEDQREAADSHGQVRRH